MDCKLVSAFAPFGDSFHDEFFVVEFVNGAFGDHAAPGKAAIHVSGAVYPESALCLFESEEMAEQYRKSIGTFGDKLKVTRLVGHELVSYCEIASDGMTTHVVINPPSGEESYHIVTLQSFKERVQLHLGETLV